MPGSKLSLSKKLQKFERVKAKPKEKLQSVFADKVNLNETSEFQDASSFNNASSGAGPMKRKFKDITEELGDNCSDSNASDSVADTCVYSCQVCNKDLSHMTIQRRQQHVNRCIDKIENTEHQKKEEERLLESARNAVLNCPMCGKNFKSETARVAHLKKCSRENNVPTDRLLQLVKDQEKERTDQLAAGIIPQELRTKMSKTAVPRKRKLKEPKNQYEEDVQVAKAMSSSIAEEQQSAGSIVTKGKGKKKGKEMLEDVCLVTTLTDEDRQKRMEEKINNILQMSNTNSLDSFSTLYDSELKASHQSTNLWDICSCHPDACENKQFYVDALVPPLCMSSSVKPGRNLKRLSSIPGREKSFVERNLLIEKGLDSATDMSVDDIISVSTQTAVVLAELAVDNTEDTEMLDILKSPTFNSTSHCDVLEASGFCVEMMTLDKSVQEELYSDTLSDYRKLVNNKEYSDVIILTSTGDKLYGHKLILLVRCPSMLQAMKESMIKLDYPTDVVMSALKFLYAGELTVALSAQNELKKLAEQFKLAPLISACDKLKLMDSKGTDEVDGDVIEKEPSELNMNEIWGESDSELDDDVHDEIIKSDMEMDDEDYREIMATQRKSLQNSEESSKTEKIKVELKKNKVVESQAKIRTEGNTALDSNCVNSVAASNETERINVALNRGKDDFPGTVEDEKSSDTENDMPKPKRLRFSNELENDKHLDECDIKCDHNESIILSDSSDEDVSVIQNQVENVSNTNKTIDDSSGVEPNDSYCANTSVDLFASPSPQKSKASSIMYNQTLAQKEEYLGNPHLLSSKILATDDANEVPVEKLKDLNDLESSELSQNEGHLDQTDNVTDGDKVDGVMDEFDENSGDDIQITGDNFNEIDTPSPTFNRSKSNCLPKFESSEHAIDKRKYLGLESKILASYNKYTGISDENIVDDNDDSDEVVLIETEDVAELHDGTAEDDNLKACGKDVEVNGHKECVAHEDIPLDHSDSEISERGNDGKNSQTGKEDSDLFDLTSEIQNQSSPIIQNESFQSNQADVWDDFDDCGVGYEPPFVSPEPPPSPEPSCSKSMQDEVIDLSQNEDDNNIHNGQLEDDLYQDFLQDGDDSFVFKVDETDGVEKKQASVKNNDTMMHFKTPTVKKADKKKPTWTVPSPFTPMPKYNEMGTPNLKKELNKYGMKPFGRKRMVKILEDVYHQTHQYETDSELEDDESDLDKSGNTENAEHESDADVAGSQEYEDDELVASQCNVFSQDSCDVMEESCLHMSSSESDTSASPQKNVDITKKLFHYFKSHSELSLKVLTFEPIELDVLKKDVKEYGIKCSMDKLMDFLDERCIAFTTKNTRKNRVQKKKGKKKSTSSRSTNDA